jgi:hypothetical protein
MMEKSHSLTSVYQLNENQHGHHTLAMWIGWVICCIRTYHAPSHKNGLYVPNTLYLLTNGNHFINLFRLGCKFSLIIYGNSILKMRDINYA